MPEWEITIDIDERFAPDVTEDVLSQALAAVLTHQEIGPAGVSIVVTDDAYVQRLNRDYRGVDAPTDVLSFASQDGGELDADFAPEAAAEMDRYLGDLILAFPYAAAQAARHNLSIQTEMRLLVVHGCLHLLGYDHDSDENQAEMWEVQATILAGLGVREDLTQRMAAE
ncbi:MAG: rRNA maturation RNase YbeY [Caldilineaceae bacterium]|nr:rRNA maturation RNase YbeY [Caldilineaceae bacterium]